MQSCIHLLCGPTLWFAESEALEVWQWFWNHRIKIQNCQSNCFVLEVSYGLPCGMSGPLMG